MVLFFKSCVSPGAVQVRAFEQSWSNKRAPGSTQLLESSCLPWFGSHGIFRRTVSNIQCTLARFTIGKLAASGRQGNDAGRKAVKPHLVVTTRVRESFLNPLVLQTSDMT